MKKLRGFTLIEAMVVLALAAIIVSVAVPSFQTLIQNNRLVTQANEFVSSLNLTRSEAVKRGVIVTMGAANPANNANEWGPGWNIWLDTDGDGTIDAGEQVLRVAGAATGNVTIDSTNGSTQLRYLATGEIRTGTANNVDFWNVCDNRSAEAGVQIDTEASGRVSSQAFNCP